MQQYLKMGYYFHSMIREAVIVDAVRTPLGRRDGKLSQWHPVDLLARTLCGLLERNRFDPELIDDVIGGCVMQVGEQSLNIPRNAVLAAGLPECIPATTVDRQCGSRSEERRVGKECGFRW